MKKRSLWKTGAHVGGVFELFGALKEFSESFLFDGLKAVLHRKRTIISYAR